MSVKVRRNNLCPCGSGKKYKKCHYLLEYSAITNEPLQLERSLAKRMQMERQQGNGRPIISTEWNGNRLVAVGGSLYAISTDKTFHDFLIGYIQSPSVFGTEWFNSQLSQPFEERHPLVKQFEMLQQFVRDNHRPETRFQNAPMTGAVYSLLHISYNLYLLQHNASIQRKLIKRLKDRNEFRGAQYETYVAAEFLKAGFLLELENEEDSNSSHCEFSATSRRTGRKYSVEAKTRQPNKKTIGISNQLYKALKKAAKYERVIFIEHNSLDFSKNVNRVVEEIAERENDLKIDSLPAPPSYIFVTNHPFEYSLNGIVENRSGFARGFKIPDFCFDFGFRNIREVLKAREKHSDMFDLIKSMCRHEEIPSTFDGEYPEFAFSIDDDSRSRLLIGEKYLIPDQYGNEIEGILEDAVVLENEKKSYGIYKTQTGQKLVVAVPLTEKEIFAFRKYPDTFFGVPRKTGAKAESPIDVFDFLYETYSKSTKEKLLEFLQGHPEIEKYAQLPQEELAIIYCELLVNADICSGRLFQK
jgi:hypothetical protein